MPCFSPPSPITVSTLDSETNNQSFDNAVFDNDNVYESDIQERVIEMDPYQRNSIRSAVSTNI